MKNTFFFAWFNQQKKSKASNKKQTKHAVALTNKKNQKPQIKSKQNTQSLKQRS